MDAKKFGNFVAEMRKENNMTQAELAEKLHVTDKAVSRWERGLGFPDINTIEPLAKALGVTVLELMQSEKSGEAVTKEEVSTALENTLSMAELQRKRLIRRIVRWIALPIAAIVALVIFYMAATGLARRGDVFIWDYSVTEYSGVVTLQVGVESSAGYVRSMKDVSDDPEKAELEFYSAFGGINSAWGASNVYVLQPGEECKEIYFRRYDGWQLVLEKNSSGEWVKPE